jgi:hypothetical protein
MEAQEPARCPDCGAEIDPETCWCGDPMKDHTESSGHAPVPMGCVCHFGAVRKLVYEQA